MKNHEVLWNLREIRLHGMAVLKGGQGATPLWELWPLTPPPNEVGCKVT